MLQGIAKPARYRDEPRLPRVPACQSGVPTRHPSLVLGAPDLVGEAETGPADVGYVHLDPQLVVESGRGVIPQLGLNDRESNPLRHERLAMQLDLAHRLDPSGLEIPNICGVMGDACRIGVGEADSNFGRAVHVGTRCSRRV